MQKLIFLQADISFNGLRMMYGSHYEAVLLHRKAVVLSLILQLILKEK